ncbi:MAG: hypothetical protein R3B36_06355 [Polyangiaceae bacterium]
MTAPCSEFPNDNPALHAGARWVCRELTGPAAVVTPTPPAIEVQAAPPEVEAAPPAPPEPAVEPAVEAAPPEVEATVEAAPPEVEAAPPEPEPEPDSFPLPEPEHPVVVVDAFDGGFIDERSQDEGDVGEPPLIVEELEPFEVVCEEGSALAEAACGTEAPAESDGEAPAARDSEAPPAGADPFSVLVCALADVAIAHGAHEIAELLPRLLGEGSLDAPLSDAARATLEASGVLEGGAVAPSVVTIAGAWRAILRGESEDYGACGAAMLDEWASELLGRVLGERARANDLRRELRARGVAAFGLIEASA